MRTEIIDITPDMAATWLEKNHHNRFLSPFVVSELAAAMTNGTWQLTHQGIAFATDGSLVDGQHRLAAVVKSGCVVPMVVNFDVEMDVFGVLDAGKKRSIADLITVERGHRHASLISAACRTALIYDRGALTDTTAWNGGTITTKLRLDRATIAEHTLKMADQVSDLVGECKVMNPGFKLNGPVVAAFYVIRRDTSEDSGQVHNFIRGVLTGEELESGDIRIRLRDSLLTVRRGYDPRLTFYITIKAWNMFVEDVTTTHLRVKRLDFGQRPL